MQTLWSRAVQTKCTCRSTVRRGLRFGDAFTAFYSSIFAVAAIADAKVKDVRRQKWDEAIAEARTDLEALEHQQQGRIDSSSANDLTDDETVSMDQVSWQELFVRAAEEKKMRIALGLERVNGIPLDLLENLSSSEIEQLLPEAVCGDAETDLWRGFKSDRYFYNGFPTNKLKTFELSISKLVLRFLLESEERRSATPKEPDTPMASAQAPSFQYREELAKRIANIDVRISAVSHIYRWPSMAIDPEAPNRPHYAEPFPDETLNTALRTVFLASEEEKADIETLSSRICYNLLVSSTPPDVHTYNMLILVLCRLRQHGLVRAVLESMRECHVPPNEITTSATLKFYTATNDRLGFERYVKEVGGRNCILDLSQPATTILHRRSDVLPHYLHKRRRLVQTKDSTGQPVDLAGAEENACMLVIQKAPRNQAVLEALFCGTLKFFGLSQARYCYKTLVEDGWEVTVRILTLMLKRCAREKNWRLGRLVWQQLHDLGLQAGKNSYYWMLHLCRSCQRDHEFQCVLREANSHDIIPGIPFAWNLSSLKRQVEMSCREIGVTAKRVGDIELRIYRGPSVGHRINRKLEMLNLDSNITQKATVRKSEDQAQVTKKDAEACLLPVHVEGSIVAQEAKDRRHERSMPQLLLPPYEAYPALPLYTQNLPSVTDLADKQFWENHGERAVMIA